jgi:hypothetical protein
MTDDNKYYCPIMGAWLPRRKIYRETIVQDEALYRAIEQHEAYKQEVSDAVEDAFGLQGGHTLHRFIIPKPKPDPLVEAIGEAMQKHEVYSKYELTDSLRAALEARGLEIRSKNDD